MKKEARLLKQKSLNSLTLSIDHFNRPWDVGRTDAVLMLLDHSFEMLLKATILHRGGRIRDLGEKNTIGFDTCVRRALSTPKVQFLTEEQALTLQAINGLRDAAQPPPPGRPGWFHGQGEDGGVGVGIAGQVTVYQGSQRATARSYAQSMSWPCVPGLVFSPGPGDARLPRSRQLVALGRDLWRQRERRARLRRIRADGRTRSLAHPGVAGCDGTSLVPGSGRGTLRRQRTVLGI